MTISDFASSGNNEPGAGCGVLGNTFINSGVTAVHRTSRLVLVATASLVGFPPPTSWWEDCRDWNRDLLIERVLQGFPGGPYEIFVS